MVRDIDLQKPSDLIRWGLLLPPSTDLGTAATDPGLLLLARGMGMLALCMRGWNLPWASKEPYSSLPNLTPARLGEMYSRTHTALVHRFEILGIGDRKDSIKKDNGEDSEDTHTISSGSGSVVDQTNVGILLYERANFRSLLKHPNQAPPAVRSALAEALGADMMALELPATQPPHDLAAAESWLSSQIMFALEDPVWGEDAVPAVDTEYDCDHCREDSYTPWELVWKYYSRRDLAVHRLSYHSPLATGHRWLESLRHDPPEVNGKVQPPMFVCPGYEFTKRLGTQVCGKSFRTHEGLADHILRTHFDDVGACLPARYLLPFAELAAERTPMDKHAQIMKNWLPKIHDWARAEDANNDSEQTRRFTEFMERHPPSEEFWKVPTRYLGGDETPKQHVGTSAIDEEKSVVEEQPLMEEKTASEEDPEKQLVGDKCGIEETSSFKGESGH